MCIINFKIKIKILKIIYYSINKSNLWEKYTLERVCFNTVNILILKIFS